MSDTDPERRLAQAEALLRHQLGHPIGDLRVVIRQEGVILRGRARSYYAKQLAQEAIMHGLRLPVVANDIEGHQALPPPESEAPDPG